MKFILKWLNLKTQTIEVREIEAEGWHEAIKKFEAWFQDEELIEVRKVA